MTGSLEEDGPHTTQIRFGSLWGRLLSPQLKYTEALSKVFGVGLHRWKPELAGQQHFDLHIEEQGTAPPARDYLLELGGTPRHPTITTDTLRAELALDAHPVQLRVTVQRAGVHFDELCVYLGVIIHKMLFFLDRVILHAAAVRVHDRVHLFVGDKGAGKSTICLGLARAGGTVLGEDSVVLRRAASGFLASGGDQRSRVTEQTERHFFPESLAVTPRDFAGTMKKEIRLGDYFSSLPYQDFPPDRLLFPRVTGRYQLRPLKAQQALLRIMAYNGHFQRFAGGTDQERFLDFLAGFIASVAAYDLELSRDLNELDRLVEDLRDG